MAQECFTKVTYAPHHVHSSDSAGGVGKEAVGGGGHAFGLGAVGAGGQPGEGGAEVAGGSVLLQAVAPLARHEGVGGVLPQVHLELLLRYALLPLLLLLRLLPRSRLPLRHLLHLHTSTTLIMNITTSPMRICCQWKQVIINS